LEKYLEENKMIRRQEGMLLFYFIEEKEFIVIYLFI
jgi:hypothetical protein